MKPTRYFVEYGQPSRPDGDEDPALYRKTQDFVSLEGAQSFLSRKHIANKAPLLFERTNLRDATPPGDPEGLLWDFDTVEVESS